MDSVRIKFIFLVWICFLFVMVCKYLELFCVKDIIDVLDSCNKKIDSYYVLC